MADTQPSDIPYPDISHLITEDGAPVDSWFAEKQMRLLTEPVWGWQPPNGRTVACAANVGVFAENKNPALVPDVFLSMDVHTPKLSEHQKNRNSYFVWDHGKAPDVVIEIVSDTPGGELSTKLRAYERIRVTHYVVFDPWAVLSDTVLSAFALSGGVYVQTETTMLPEVGLGLALWNGSFEKSEATWLRWCHLNGDLLPTGNERAEQECARAEQERARADALEARVRELEKLTRAGS